MTSSVIWDDCRSLKAIGLILIARAAAVVLFVMVSAEMMIQLRRHAHVRHKDDFLILCIYVNE